MGLGFWFGEGADWLPLLVGRLKALVSDERNPDIAAGTGVSGVPPAVLCSVSTAIRWLWVSSRIFCASSCGSRGGGRSSCERTVLSVSVLDWSDSPVSELPGFLGLGGALTGDVGVLTLPLDDTPAPRARPPLPPPPPIPPPRAARCPAGRGRVPRCANASGSLLMMLKPSYSSWGTVAVGDERLRGIPA